MHDQLKDGQVPVMTGFVWSEVIVQGGFQLPFFLSDVCQPVKNEQKQQQQPEVKNSSHVLLLWENPDSKRIIAFCSPGILLVSIIENPTSKVGFSSQKEKKKSPPFLGRPMRASSPVIWLLALPGPVKIVGDQTQRPGSENNH
ncbi:MAG: hypothetical protein J5I94_27675 [Phaeodactylibacter sp.]|nr:hypothetical protein [Phaeodactylibacter sp.]